MAKVLSSISGNLISAASAGYAPTNSADVSAIASAYQVVSATGTRLYAGTAHVTSINSAPLSASRARMALNASMANSAYYDGTGRLISALPDSAAVSSIASSYAPTFGLNGGKISSINGSALDAPTGGGVVTATGSAWCNANICVSSVNGSGLMAQSATQAAEDSFGYNIQAYYAKYSSLTGVSSTVANNSASWGAGPTISSPSGTIVVNGGNIEGTNSAVLTASATGFSSTGYLFNNCISDGMMVRLTTDVLPGTGGVLRMSADTQIYRADILLSGQDSASNFVTSTATVSGDTRDIVIPLGAIDRFISASASQYITFYGNNVYTAEKTGGVVATGVAELAWKSAVDSVTNTVSSNSASWGGGGGVDSATVSAIASSYAESAVSSKADSSALSSYALSSDVSGCIDTMSSNSATWATVTSKLDSSASSSFYTTANESGYIGSAYVESSISAYQPVSGMSAYESSFSAGVGLEFVQSGSDRVLQVEAPVDIVAGPGIVIDNPDGNTLRVSTDLEYSKVLYSANSVISSTPGYVYPMAESMLNFERIRIWFANREFTGYQCCHEFYPTQSNIMVGSMDASEGAGNSQRLNMGFSADASGNLVDAFHNLWFGSYANPSNASGAGRGLGILRVDGIHRTASN